MTSLFELFVDAESAVRFRILAPDGTVMAVSKAFDDKPAAVAGMAAVHEDAGLDISIDRCPAGQSNASDHVPASPARDTRQLNPAAGRGDGAGATKSPMDGRRLI